MFRPKGIFTFNGKRNKKEEESESDEN